MQRSDSISHHVEPVLQFLSIEYHFLNIERGVIDSRDVLYYISVIVFLLTLSRQFLESRKWS